MTVLVVLAYLADVAIISSYFWLVQHPDRGFPLHVANAVGGIPLLGVEALTGAYAVMPVTLAFTLLGWYGIARDWMDMDFDYEGLFETEDYQPADLGEFPPLSMQDLQNGTLPENFPVRDA